MKRPIPEAKEKNILFFLISVFLASSLIFKDGTSFILSLFLIILSVIFMLGKEDAKFLAIVFIISFFVRIVLMYLLHWQSYKAGFEGFISGDDRLYTLKAIKIALSWQHLPYNMNCDTHSPGYGLNPFTYILALFFRLFEPNYLSSKLINCLIGSMAPLVIYLIAKDMFSAKVAKLSFALASFYPSMVRWSIGNLRDPIIIFLTVMTFYLLLALRKNRYRIMKSIAVLFILVLLKKLQIVAFAAFLLIIALFAVYNFFKILRSKNKPVFLVVLIAVIILSILFMACEHDNIKGSIVKFLQSTLDRSISLYIVDNAGYLAYDSHTIAQLRSGILDLGSLVIFYFKAIGYFILVPFPWRLSSLNQILAYPQIVLWYLLLFLSVVGFTKALKISKENNFFIIMFFLIGISIFAMVESNMGSAFRHRDIFSFIIFIYAMAGLNHMFLKKEISAHGKGR